LAKAIEAVENKLQKRIFDKQGNFSFGIKEHIDIPGVKYDPDVGIMGMDVCVTLERPGFRVKKKRLGSKIGKNHLIKPEDAIEWVTKNYKVEVI
jgi:large subunit ribosomal protein L5